MSSSEIKLKTPEPESVAVEELNAEKLLMGESQMNESEHENIIDELTSIERDLAIMHDIEHDDHEAPNVLQSGIVEEALAMGIASSSNDAPAEKQEESPVSKSDGKQDSTVDKVGNERRNGESNNSDITNDAPDSTTGSAAAPTKKPEETPLMHDDLLAVLKGTDTEDSGEGGVTIEGEGEFQIVDIIDSEVESTETDPLAGGKDSEKPLTKEQARKVALEQFQSLSRPSAKAREPKSRRKQDIKPITQPADLLTSLVSDWSDGDEANADDSEGSPPKKKAAASAAQGKATQMKPAAQGKPAVQVAKPIQIAKTAATAKATQAAKPAAAQQAKATASKAPPKPVQKPEPSTEKDKGKDAQAPTAGTAATSSKKPANTTQSKKQSTVEKKQPDPPPQPTFKRTRIIKRKIIWDPDAPETQFSYAKLVKPSVPTPAKKEKTATPKLKDDVEEATRSRTPPVKRPPSTTPSVNGGNRKKNSREIDRLLGDEGAVNMLNSLESERSKRTPDSDSISPRAAAARKSTAASTTPASASTSTPPEKPQPAAATKRESLLAKNRKTKAKASSAWDYVYKRKKQQDDEAMIIRRRSNSSYSSSASINRLSVDGPGSANRSIKTPKTSIGSVGAEKDASTPTDADNQFEFAKPENKAKAKKMKSPIILVNALSVDMKKGVAKRPIRSSTASDDEDDSEDDDGDIEEISLDPKQTKGDVKVLAIGNVKQVTFNTHRAKLANTFTVQLMNELSRVLGVLSKDNDCKAVLMISEGTHFCQGIDFTDLTIGTAEKRKTAAVQMARAVKNFLSTLAKFNKPLIAGVNGSNSGLGVTMLPLFDVVIGSDKGTYETPYAKIGQIPEGYYIFSETSKIRSTFKTKLLWLAEKLHSTESALSGLINKLTSVGKVNEEALSAAKRIASLAPETYSVMKKRSIENALPLIIDALEDEEEILVRQWCSAPCLENLKHFIQKGQW